MKKDKFFCGLDIGTRRLKAAVVRMEGDRRFEILGVGQTATQGLKRSSVSELQDLSQAIQHLISGLGRRLDVKIKEVFLGIGGHLIEHRQGQAVIPLADRGNKIITRFDIKKLNRQAALLNVNFDERVLHNIPTHFIVDGFNQATNPIGLYGHKLEARNLIVIAKNNLINNISKAVNQAGVDIAQINFSTFAAAQALLTPQEKEQGCLFLNIGASTSDMILFKEGTVRHLFLSSIAGDALTEQISQGLQLPFDLAEDIKLSYATVIENEANVDKEEILVKQEKGYHPVERLQLCRAIMPGVEAMIDDLQNALRDFGGVSMINAGIIVTGGGVLLPGFMEYLDKKFGVPTRIAKIKADVKHAGNPALFAPCVGLATQNAQDPLGEVAPVDRSRSVFSRLTSQVKEIYQEYF